MNAYPGILTPFNQKIVTHKQPFYVDGILRIMGHLFPPHFFEEEDAFLKFQNQLPIVCWTRLERPPCNLSFYLCCHFRLNAFRFFHEMISRWLIPGKNINVLLQFASDFAMPELSHHKYICGEVMLQIDHLEDFEILQKNLPIIESEIRLGIESRYQANRILEIKGLKTDEKTALIQENMASLVKLRPQNFDFDIFSEMQHFLILCKEDFKAVRDYRHMSRIICVHYLFRKTLKYALEAFPDKRTINIKLIRARIRDSQSVLGVAIGISFLKTHERFEAHHILNGIRTVIPDVKMIEGSFFYNHRGEDQTSTFYLEIEREGGKISLEEENILKEYLPQKLQNRIEQRLNPIFMPQNEEEVMRHILTLSNQLKYVRDLPQVTLTFSQQSEEYLEFLVVLLRVKKKPFTSISDLFEAKPSFLEFILDRIKIVGTLRKKYKKEAHVFRLRIRKRQFLRQDHSVDLYQARHEVVEELARVIGEFRDYNGGIISKENELFSNLRRMIGKSAKENSFLLKNFFYTLTPPLMRSVLPPEPLKKLFGMLLEAEEEGLVQGQNYLFRIHEDSEYFYLLLIASDGSFRELLEPFIKEMSGSSFQIATCFLQNRDFPCYGLIYRNPDPEQLFNFRMGLEQVMSEWSEHL